MLIWMLAVVLLASVAVVGFNLGAIRAGFSFVGLMVATFLAFPVGRFLAPVLGLFGVKDPIWLWALGPLVAFLLVLTAFKLTGVFVHQKVDVFYKYKAGDLRMGMFERLNHRLGLALGIANGAIYLMLLSVPIYPVGYATTQLASGDTVGWMTKLVSAAAQSLDSSGMSRIAAALNPVPEAYFDAVDTVALIYHNDLLEGRLSRYPGFLSLGERPEFQDIAKDKEFSELRQKQPPFADILNHPKAQALVNNPDMVKMIWQTVAPDLKDFQAYLRTGRSTKYDGEKILGRWSFDLGGALNLIRRANPDLNSIEMGKRKAALADTFSRATFVAAPDKTAIVKNLATVKFVKSQAAVARGAAAAPPLKTFEYSDIQGTWVSSGDGKYQIDARSRGTLEAVVDWDTLTATGDVLPWRFTRDY